MILRRNFYFLTNCLLVINQDQLRPMMEKMKPLPSIYSPDFIAANQSDRADNLITGTKQQQVDQIRSDIRQFRT